MRDLVEKFSLVRDWYTTFATLPGHKYTTSYVCLHLHFRVNGLMKSQLSVTFYYLLI